MTLQPHHRIGTVPSLPDGAYENQEAARRALAPHPSKTRPAARYGTF